MARDRRGGNTTTAPIVSETTAAGTTGKKVVPVTLSGLQVLATTLRRPIYWAGPQPGKTYELTVLPKGDVYIRYLPPGAKLGASTPLLTVGTYPVTGAFAAAQRSAAQPASVRLSARTGGVAFYSKSAPTSVYLAYPGLDYQIEVYDPAPAEARQLVESGRISPVRSSQNAPAIVPVAGLKALARSIGHPVYWAGPRQGAAYELRKTTDGLVYIRYLPAGTQAGANVAALTVGTYPAQGAFATAVQQSRRSDSVQVPVTGGGVAFYGKSAPTSVYLAYPGSDFQIEVYDPSAAQARRLVTSGKIVPIR